MLLHSSAAGAGALIVPTRVRSNVVMSKERHEQGLYNPHVPEGNIIVDTFLASCYTDAVRPGVAAALLRPVFYGVGLVHALAAQLTGAARAPSSPA